MALTATSLALSAMALRLSVSSVASLRLGSSSSGVAAHGFFRLGVDRGGFFLLGGIMRSVMASFEAGGLASSCLPFGAAGRV